MDQVRGSMPQGTTVDQAQALLMRRIAAEDRSALAELYDQAAPALFSFAVHMLGDTQDAEEVIQDVFLQVWTKARTFDPDLGLAFAWVMSITRNRCIDRLRSRRRRARVFVTVAEDSDIEPPIDLVSGPMNLLAEEAA